jgi:hypothetical protein
MRRRESLPRLRGSSVQDAWDCPMQRERHPMTTEPKPAADVYVHATEPSASDARALDAGGITIADVEGEPF